MKKSVFIIMILLLPMLANADESGVCGDGVIYSFDDTTKTLTNSWTGEGTGMMYDYGIKKDPLWSHLDVQYLVIQEGVTSIGYEAFLNCNGLISVTIPSSVTIIGNGAFQGCCGLTSITIPNNVTSVGYSAFADCSGLISATIGNSVTYIGEGAFIEADHLTTIVSKIENPFVIKGKSSRYRTFEENTFNNATLYIPVGTIGKYKDTIGWRDFNNIEESPTETGVENVKIGRATLDEPIYDLQGRRLSAKPQKGLYIQNGKKMWSQNGIKNLSS